MALAKISSSSEKDFDITEKVKTMPWKKLEYEGRPNFVVILGMSSAGKDTVMAGLFYLFAYAAAEKNPELMKTTAMIGRSVALEDRLNGIISEEEAEKFPMYPPLDSSQDIVAALEFSQAHAKTNYSIKDAVKHVKTERMKLLKPIEQDISYQLIRSCVTRKIRKGEVPGEIYDFISEEEFSQRVKRRDFLEIAYVHNNGWYATPKSNITEDKFGLKIIDPQGCEMVIKTYDSKADIKPYFVIIDIPLLEMVRRLNKRGTEDMTEKAKRLWSVLKEKRLINKIREYATSASVENTGHIYDTRLAVYNILANQNIVQRIDKYPSSFF